MDQIALEALAGRIADRIGPGSRLFLTGDLGAGKSVFARAVLRKLGVEGNIPSPSFIVDAVYCASGLEIHHIDLYRLDGQKDELEFYGILEVLESDAAAIIEWAERLNEYVPEKGIYVNIGFTEDPAMREVLIDERDLVRD